MPEQAQKKISKEAARMIFESILPIRGNGPHRSMRDAVDVLQEIDDLVENGGGDTVGLFLRQASRKGLVDGEDVERIESRQASDSIGDSGDLSTPDELFVRQFARSLVFELLSELLKNAGLVKSAREREANRAGLNGGKDDLKRRIVVKGNAFFF